VTPRFSLVVRPLAREDIADAASWYEDRAVGLGTRFLASVDAGLRAVQEAPERYRRVYGDVRRVPVPDFPYALYFVTRGEQLHVLACMHGRRHPSRWQGRARDL
jgi:plasmid stabilization system protein ParE